MQPSDVQSALAAAVEEVLETMCFSSVLASDAGEPGDQLQSPIAAELEFEGNPPGRFRLAVPAEAAQALASAFLGLDAEPSDTQVREVTGELANMICGSVLSRLESEQTFHLRHPEILAPTAEPAQGATRWFDLGDGILITSLQLQPQIP